LRGALGTALEPLALDTGVYDFFAELIA